MIKQLDALPMGIDGFKVVGNVTKMDYETTFEPLLEKARREGRRVRLLFQLGSEFEGFTPAAMLEDAKVGLRYVRLFEGCALVTDVAWIRQWTKIAAFLMPCPVRVFGNEDLNFAVEWLKSLPETRAISLRMIAESGIIVVEVTERLRAGDFDALANTADEWIRTHGDLQGVVVHSREFPGWENLRSLVRHVQFLRRHRRKVRKFALVTDAKHADAAPSVAEHLMSAEVKHFPYADLERAIEWARTPTPPRPSAVPGEREAPRAPMH